MNTDTSIALPKEFVERLSVILPQESVEKVLSTFKTRTTFTFRINLLQSTTTNVIKRLKSEGFNPVALEWPCDFFTLPVTEKRRLSESSVAKNNEIYIQNPSSAIPVYILNPQDDEEILDLTAAPGGKTIYIAEKMHNTGRIAAVEAVKNRFYKLNSNLKRHGVQNTKTYFKDGRRIGKLCPARFDRILLDAPCSSEARFNVDDARTFSFWSMRKIKEMQKKQKGLIQSAVDALKKGGQLIYCTCSFAPEENEEVIDFILKKNTNLVVNEITLPIQNIMNGIPEWNGKLFSSEITKCIRILPNDIMNGFFICNLQKI